MERGWGFEHSRSVFDDLDAEIKRPTADHVECDVVIIVVDRSLPGFPATRGGRYPEPVDEPGASAVSTLAVLQTAVQCRALDDREPGVSPNRPGAQTSTPSAVVNATSVAWNPWSSGLASSGGMAEMLVAITARRSTR